MTHINIKERRLDLGLHLEDVAKRVGVSAATVSRWESGEIRTKIRKKCVGVTFPHAVFCY